VGAAFISKLKIITTGRRLVSTAKVARGLVEIAVCSAGGEAF
jgi:hypothetical protein